MVTNNSQKAQRSFNYSRRQEVIFEEGSCKDQ
ncbi:unnamed protein product, partial [Linum tenue]